MAQHVFDVTTFRLLFPAYASVTAYPNVTLDAFWAASVAYLGDYDSCLLTGAARQQALNLLAAHLLALGDMAARGQTPGTVVMSRIDKITVQLAAPPAQDAWSWWLAMTPYGAQLWALLSLQGAGGLYIGGRPERLAFRGLLGRFG